MRIRLTMKRLCMFAWFLVSIGCAARKPVTDDTGSEPLTGGERIASESDDASVGASGPLANFCEPDHIRTMVTRQSPPIMQCFEKATNAGRLRYGTKLHVRFTIMWNGNVGAAEIVERSNEDLEFEECVLGEVRRIEFDRPTGGVCIINYPFVFHGEKQ